MNEENANPCGTCSTHYGCCSLKGACGLMLTKEEFDRHFKEHTEKLVIRSVRDFIIISSADGYACPHLEADGCRIYSNRPIDCRLFPYMINHVFANRWRIRVVFHDKSDCPGKKLLIQAPEEAGILAMRFARAVFGTDRPVMVKFEKRKTLVSRTHNVIDKLLARL